MIALETIFYGPNSLKRKLEIDITTISDELIHFLESKKERLDVYHRHMAVVTCNGILDGFTLNLMITTSKEKIVGLSLSNPFTRTTAIYKMNEIPENIHKFVEEISEINYPKIEIGIVKLPIRTKFLSLYGGSQFLKKEIFSESIKGEEYFGFSKKVDDNIYEKFKLLRSGSFEQFKTYINDDGINVFVLDKSLDQDYIPLFSELLTVLRKKYNLKPAKYFNIQEKILTSILIDLEEIFNDEPLKKVNELVSQYESIKSFVIKNLESIINRGDNLES